MKATFTLLQSILIFVLMIVLTAVTMPWATEKIGESMEITELNSIKPQFDECNERIIETARTGSTNTCIFNIKKGEITGRQEGIYYKLLSNAPICDESSLVEIDPRTHIWQECTVSGNQRIYGLLWKFPSTLNVSGEGVEGNQMAGQTSISEINFLNPVVFDTLTLYVNFQYQLDQIGNVVEFSRVGITQTNITLKLKIS